MPKEVLSRREFFKSFIPVSLLTQLQPPKEPRVLEVMDPEQYTQQEFNTVAAIGISVSLEGLGNLNRRMHAVEKRLPIPHVSMPEDSKGNL